MTSVPKTPWAAPLAALHRMNEALAQAVTTAEVVQGSFAGVLSELGAGSVAVWLVNDEQTALEFVRAVGSIEETVSRFAQLPMDASLPGPRVVVTRRPVTYSSTKQRDADWPQLTGIPTATEAVAILPLVARQACLGCLSIGFVEQREFTDEDLSFMAAVADQCALAFDRARLFDAEHAARATLEFLAEATRLMVSSLDPDEVLRRLVELAVPRLGDWCAVMVEEDGMLRLAALRVAGLPHVTERAFPDDPIAVDADSPTARAFRTGEVQEVPEIPEAAQSLLTGGPAAEAVRAVPIRSGVVVPIVARGEPIGTLGLMSSAAGRRYDSQLRYAAEGFAARAGIALDNARRFDEERRTARTLTEALLPGRLPDLPGYRCATRYLPAAGNVCGDWFDMLRTPTGKVMFGVGDAAGHGIPAASLMAELRNAARGLALAGHRPGQLLDELARLADSDTDVADDNLEAENFATALYAQLDPPTGRVIWSAAGHLPPLVVARWGINFVTSDPAPPLGHAGAPVHLDRELNLGPGEGIVLFTDGVVERRDESLDVGLKRLAEIVATVESSSPDVIADTIVTELCADRKDDCCILVVRRDS